MVAGLLVNGCWVVSHGCWVVSSRGCWVVSQWLLGCYLTVAGLLFVVAGLLVNSCWDVIQWLLGC